MHHCRVGEVPTTILAAAAAAAAAVAAKVAVERGVTTTRFARLGAGAASCAAAKAEFARVTLRRRVLWTTVADRGGAARLVTGATTGRASSSAVGTAGTRLAAMSVVRLGMALAQTGSHESESRPPRMSAYRTCGTAGSERWDDGVLRREQLPAAVSDEGETTPSPTCCRGLPGVSTRMVLGAAMFPLRACGT